jgi:hypothetical protein
MLVRMALGQYVLCWPAEIFSSWLVFAVIVHIQSSYHTRLCFVLTRLRGVTLNKIILIIRHFQGFVAEATLATFPLSVVWHVLETSRGYKSVSHVMWAGPGRCLPFAECTCTSEN